MLSLVRIFLSAGEHGAETLAVFRVRAYSLVGNESFLGPPPEPPADQITNPNYVGSFSIYFAEIFYSIAQKRSQRGSSPGVKLKSDLQWCVEKVSFIR